MLNLLGLRIEHLLDTYGYTAVFVVVALENLGLPVPGETILITAAVYAGTTRDLRVTAIVVTAAVAATVGAVAGYAIGRYGGARLLHRYGRYLHLDERDVRFGRYLFQRYGGRVVFFGRFVAFLRALAALLAGINCMKARRFLVFTALGAFVWASTFGFSAYALGRQIERISPGVSVALAVGVILAAIAALRFVQRNRTRLQQEADRLSS